jgi:hypothetical protein
MLCDAAAAVCCCNLAQLTQKTRNTCASYDSSCTQLHPADHPSAADAASAKAAATVPCWLHWQAKITVKLLPLLPKQHSLGAAAAPRCTQTNQAVIP